MTGPSNRLPRLLHSLMCVTVLLAFVPAEQVSLDFRILEVVDAENLVVAVRNGDYRGRWSLQLARDAEGLEVGQRGRLRTSREVLESKKGRVVVDFGGFKGTDEELQAIIDWLGSLEAQESRP